MAEKKHDYVDMKMSATEIRAYGPGVGPDRPRLYPYGLQFSLESSQLEKLGMKHMPEPGDKFEVHAKVHVESSYESKSTDNAGDRRVTLQITSMCLQQNFGPENA